MIDMLFCMVYTSYYLAHVLYRNSWVFSVQFNYNLLCSCCIMMSGLVMISYLGDMLCMSYLPNLLYFNKGLLEWFLWHVTLCLSEPLSCSQPSHSLWYDTFMMCSWYVHACWMVLSWLDIPSYVCDMLCMYYLTNLQWVFFQPEDVGMVFMAL